MHACAWRRLSTSFKYVREPADLGFVGIDRVVQFVSAAAERAGFSVMVEPRFIGRTLGVRKPDFVLWDKEGLSLQTSWSLPTRSGS